MKYIALINSKTTDTYVIDLRIYIIPHTIDTDNQIRFLNINDGGYGNVGCFSTPTVTDLCRTALREITKYNITEILVDVSENKIDTDVYNAMIDLLRDSNINISIKPMRVTT